MHTTTTPLIFDGHNDTLLNLYLPELGGGRSFFARDPAGISTCRVRATATLPAASSPCLCPRCRARS